jgi:hypothetical protein
MASSNEIEQLLKVIDRAYDRKSWHGTNLRGSIRRVTAAQAARRPAPTTSGNAAYWKYAVRRRLIGEKRGTFALGGSNWFVRPEPGRASDADWHADVALLGNEQRRLRDAIAALPPRELHTSTGAVNPFDLITGVAAHDLYHAGQIQLLRKQSARS